MLISNAKPVSASAANENTPCDTLDTAVKAAIAHLVDGTAQRILFRICHGYPYTLKRRVTESTPLIVVANECLDVYSWNVWLEHKQNANLEQFKVDATDIALLDQNITMELVIRILRKTTLNRQATGYLSIEEAIALYYKFKGKGVGPFTEFLKTLKSIGKTTGLMW